MYFVLLALDYDGTLATDGVVDDETIDALRRLKETGRKLVMVTGRELPSLKQVFDNIKLFDCIVAENGALLYLPDTHEEKPIAPPPPEALVSRLRSMGIKPLSVGRSIIATWEPNETAVLEAIRDLGVEMQITFNKGAVMVLPTGINKASGLAAALDHLGISQLNVIGIGDAENDQAFLRSCGCAVAVANALPTVKEGADIVTSGARGAGVRQIIEQLLEHESGLIHSTARHRAVFGKDAQGGEVALAPNTGGVLILGQSGQGKSTLATALIERLIDRGFQICVIDPEGDYSRLENTVMLGDEKHPPTSNAILDLLASRENHVVVNMLAIDVADRTAFFAELLPKLANMRAATGRPHWILIDEAHHMLPAARGEVSMTLPRELPATILVTVHPDAVAPAALEAIGVVLAIGDASPDLLMEVCQVMKQDCPVLPAASPSKGEALLWQRMHDEAKLITVEQPRQAHKRHTRKYAEGNLGEDKSFYFRGPRDALNLRAQNVMLFLQIGDGVDDETWLHHLRAGDYSAWFRTAIKDDELADEVAKIETDRQLNIEESRSRLQELVQRRYTLPARP